VDIWGGEGAGGQSNMEIHFNEWALDGIFSLVESLKIQSRDVSKVSHILTSTVNVTSEQ